jgi:hypothetical protein
VLVDINTDGERLCCCSLHNICTVYGKQAVGSSEYMHSVLRATFGCLRVKIVVYLIKHEFAKGLTPMRIPCLQMPGMCLFW